MLIRGGFGNKFIACVNDDAVGNDYRFVDSDDSFTADNAIVAEASLNRATMEPPQPSSVSRDMPTAMWSRISLYRQRALTSGVQTRFGNRKQRYRGNFRPEWPAWHRTFFAFKRFTRDRHRRRR